MDDIMEVEGPDGNIYEFPVGTTREQAIAYLKKLEAKPLTTGERFMQGVVDPVAGAAQLLESAVPKAVSDKVNAANNFLAQYGIVAPVSEEGLGADVAKRERDYATRLSVTPGFEDGQMDWARIGGTAISPASIGMAYAAPASLPGILGTGAVMGATQPSAETGDEYWKDKAVQTAVGAGGSAVGAAGSRLAGKVISPRASVDPSIQTLRREGVSPTFGQLLGPVASKMEQGLASAPILGTAIKESRTRAFEDLNRAVANRALRPIGEEIGRNVRPGFDMVDDVAARISARYDQVLPNINGQLDKAFRTELGTIRQMGNSLPTPQRDQLNRIIRDEVMGRFTQNGGVASGETIKNIESKLGQIAKGYMRDPDYDRRTLGAAIRETQAALRRMVERVNPDSGPELQAINSAWSELTRLENAAGRAGATEGIFTPGQLNLAIKQLDPKRGGRGFSHGNARGQDLSRAAQKILGGTVPDSGTPFRTALGLGMLGGGYLAHPMIPIAELGIAMAPYSKTGQRAANAFLADRPQWAAPLAGGLQRMTKYGVPGTVDAADELSQ